MLNNSRLSEETLINAKLQLISLTRARESRRQTEAGYVLKSKLDKLGEVAAQLGEIPDELHFRCFTSETLATAKSKTKRAAVPYSSQVRKRTEFYQVLMQRSKSQGMTLGERLLRPTPRCRLNLDDAVVALGNLSFFWDNSSRPWFA